MDGVAAAGEGLLWPLGGVLPCFRACNVLFVGSGVDPDLGGWPAMPDPLGQAEYCQH